MEFKQSGNSILQRIKIESSGIFAYLNRDIQSNKNHVYVNLTRIDCFAMHYKADQVTPLYSKCDDPQIRIPGREVGNGSLDFTSEATVHQAIDMLTDANYNTQKHWHIITLDPFQEGLIPIVTHKGTKHHFTYLDPIAFQEMYSLKDSF